MNEHQEIREALEKATPGPWKCNAKINGYGISAAGVFFEQISFATENSGINRDREAAKNNAHLIANAPTWLRQLLDENQELREANAKWALDALFAPDGNKTEAFEIQALREENARYREALEEIKEEEWRLAGEFTTIYLAAYHALIGSQEE